MIASLFTQNSMSHSRFISRVSVLDAVGGSTLGNPGHRPTPLYRTSNTGSNKKRTQVSVWPSIRHALHQWLKAQSFIDWGSFTFIPRPNHTPSTPDPFFSFGAAGVL